MQPKAVSFIRLGSPLDEIVLFSVHKCYVVIGRCDVIRELGNRCYAGLLYCLVFGQWLNIPLASTCSLTSGPIRTTGQYAEKNQYNRHSKVLIHCINCWFSDYPLKQKHGNKLNFNFFCRDTKFFAHNHKSCYLQKMLIPRIALQKLAQENNSFLLPDSPSLIGITYESKNPPFKPYLK